MNADARRAIATIHRCIAADRVLLTQHFRLRLLERGLLWVDVLTVVDAPSRMRADGVDDWGRFHWIIDGEAADGSAVELVCAIGRTSRGEPVVFVTMFWED